MLDRLIKFFLVRKLVTVLLTVSLVIWGLASAPFSWDLGGFPRNPVVVDAIPDIGENQQIVFTEWMGRSPQDVEDQVTYPLTTALLGIPGVKTIRSSSIFGVSSIYLIFDEHIEFYWSRSRILEKLNSLPTGTLPDGVQPVLGPDATALGQIFWYTLEGRDQNGSPAGGWDPHELRSIQDFYLKYGLSSAEGVSEVASIGGHVKEYQVEIDPVAIKSYQVTVADIMQAVKKSNLDVGARTIEYNKAEYLVRGLGYIKDIGDLEEAVIVARNNIPVRIKDVCRVQLGPATRRGGLDKAGAEAVGAVVVARYGANPLEVINNVKDKIAALAPGLPSKTLEDGTVSKVTVIPFYDRTGLIRETLGTLEEALSLEILISIIVVIILVMNLRASLIISILLPIGVLMTFIAMKHFGVSANIVALSGIAIAIGVMVDVGVVFTENMVRHLDDHKDQGDSEVSLELIHKATMEVAPAVMTALATTIVSFLPVFALQAQEGKLFTPLAFTKTFALVSALLIGIIIIPALAHWVFSRTLKRKKSGKTFNLILLVAGLVIVFWVPWAGLVLIALGVTRYFEDRMEKKWPGRSSLLSIAIVLSTVLYFLTRAWLPLGPEKSLLVNLLFVALLVAFILGLLMLVVRYYPDILGWCLEHKKKFLSIPIAFVIFGLLTWQGFNNLFGFMARAAEAINWQVRQTAGWEFMTSTFPGIGREFMPPLDEGSFLLMPSTMPHSGVEENIETIRLLDLMVTAIPEVEVTVGKWGRAASALDPAPISMYENVVNYKPEYLLDVNGHRVRFKIDQNKNFMLSTGGIFNPDSSSLQDFNTGLLIPDKNGRFFRQWRSHIKTPDDIWNEIVIVTNIPGLTSAPKLQPIATRLIMLSTGIRAPMGIKIFGPDLATIERVGYRMEELLKQVPGVKPASVFADRVVGKPYLGIKIDRKAIARYGLSIEDMQTYIGAAVGGNAQTTTVEGRERYAVRVRYAREFRDNPDDLRGILIPTPTGIQIPLGELAELQYQRGPQNIKSENTFLVSYVIFDKQERFSEVEVVNNAQAFFNAKMEDGTLEIPGGVSYQFAGNYENQIRASKRLSVVIPISMLVIFLILYFQFGKLQPTLMVFTGIFAAFAGGFMMVWLYGQDWFLDFFLFGENLRDLFQVKKLNLSVAVWVGFIALFGIASDDGVLIGTRLKQTFDSESPSTVEDIRQAVIQAGQLRIRPAMMTTATTLIALLPILTSTGKGAEIMIPMAIPTFGGMLIQSISVFIVPVLYAMWQESRVHNRPKRS